MKGKSKFFKRTLAIVMAVVMTMTAGVFVFADASSDDVIKCYTGGSNYVELYFNKMTKVLDTSAGTNGVKSFGTYAGYDSKYLSNINQNCSGEGTAILNYKNNGDLNYYTATVSIPQTTHVGGPWVVRGNELGSTVTLDLKCIYCNTTIDTKILNTAEHTHDTTNAKVTITSPTCTTVGLKGRYCTYCDAYYDLEEIEANGHCEEANYIWEVAIPATCTSKGFKVAKCCDCGMDVATGEIEKADHIYGEYFTEVVAATKETEGLKARFCLVCGAIDEASKTTIPATHIHTFTSSKITLKDSTCTEKGLEAKFCTGCFALDPESVSEIGVKSHNANLITETIPATCTTAGETRTLCPDCYTVVSVEKIDAIGHTSTTDITVLQPTCAEKGAILTICNDCGAIIKETPIDETENHTWQTVVLTEATDSTEGKMVKRCAVCGTDGEEIAIPKNHTHEYNIPLTKEATCIDAGYTVQTCSCGAWNMFTYRVVNKLNHAEGPWETVIPGDCTHGATQYKYCQRCFAVVDEQTLEADGHDQNFEYPVITADCVKDGLVYSFCSKCGKMSGSEVIERDENAHDYQWEIIREANEETGVTGLKKLQCTRCGNVSDTVETPVHTCADHYGAMEIIEPTCELAGYKMRKCTICDAYNVDEIEALGHEESTLEIVAPTCAHTGLTITICSRCGLLTSSELTDKTTDHIPGEWVEVIPVTEISNGYMVQYCAECGAQVDSKEIKAHEHVYGAFEVLYEATCTRDGIEAQLCIECGAMNSETAKITEGKHDPSDYITTKAPTCTESGMKETYCLRCDKKLSSEVIPALSHNTSDGQTWYEEKAATCTSTGLKVLKCVDCGKVVQTEIIDKADHETLEDTNWRIIKDATCTEYGEKVLECVNCGKVVKKDTTSLAPKGHNNHWVTTLEPTCVDPGMKEVVCTVCGFVSGTEEIPALGHKCTTHANCLYDGICDRCGLVLEYSDAKDHVFSEWTTFKKATFFKDEVQKRTCHVCGLNEYRFIDGSSGVHNKCCLHRDSGCCFLCKVTRSVQTTFFVIFHGAGAVIGGNIVSRVLFPDLWKWTFCEIFRFPFVKYDK